MNSTCVSCTGYLPIRLVGEQKGMCEACATANQLLANKDAKRRLLHKIYMAAFGCLLFAALACLLVVAAPDRLFIRGPRIFVLVFVALQAAFGSYGPAGLCVLISVCFGGYLIYGLQKLDQYNLPQA